MQSVFSPIRRPICSRCLQRALVPVQQTRNATLIKRPRRPYTFTQLVQLSDGSAYLQRTTSPAPVYKSSKDTRNTPLWNPSSDKLLNLEDDEAGRLRMFRQRFGRGFDTQGTKAETSEKSGSVDDVKFSKKAKQVTAYDDEDDSLLDLITSFGIAPKGAPDTKGSSAPGAKGAPGKKK